MLIFIFERFYFYKYIFTNGQNKEILSNKFPAEYKPLNIPLDNREYSGQEITNT